MKLKKSFTLIELLISIGIIGILVGVGVPIYNNYKKEVQHQVRYNQLQQLIRYLETQFISMGCPLNTLECTIDFDLTNLRINDKDIENETIRKDIEKILSNLLNFSYSINSYISTPFNPQSYKYSYIQLQYEDKTWCNFYYVLGDFRDKEYNKPTLTVNQTKSNPKEFERCGFGGRLNIFNY